MTYKYLNNKKQQLKSLARELRNNMTPVERKLWLRIRRKQVDGCQFYRQRIIGNYIVDFYCHSAKLVIEVDGSQHYKYEAKRKDEIRDSFLADLGLIVLRFSNRDVMLNLDSVLQVILNELVDRN